MMTFKTIKELNLSIEERRTRRPLTKEECGLKGYRQALKHLLELVDENTNFIGGWKITPEELKKRIEG